MIELINAVAKLRSSSNGGGSTHCSSEPAYAQKRVALEGRNTERNPQVAVVAHK